MKHIKPFNEGLFRKKKKFLSISLREFTDNFIDILKELMDIGFTVKSGFPTRKHGYDFAVYTDIRKHSNKFDSPPAWTVVFVFDEVEDTILRLIDYSKSSNAEINVNFFAKKTKKMPSGKIIQLMEIVEIPTISNNDNIYLLSGENIKETEFVNYLIGIRINWKANQKPT